MKTLFHLTLVVLILSTGPAMAGSVSGNLHSSKDLKESQRAAVVWIEGLSPGVNASDKPVMSQSGIQFAPRVLAVVAGQTVDFPNNDDVAHNVFSMSKTKRFKLGIYPKGESREVTFEKPGVIDLFCSIHRHMHAVIVVTPSEHAAQAEIGKTYTIEDVPAGSYKVHAWNSAHKKLVQEVTVAQDGETTLDFAFEE
ncbi:cupredoxin domain-containing protein [Aeoliella sp.]|uniref:cupredoxin domain-containing protein n=1 Tax=Aeoliella sp. TaxID=2795800 RepID=UPI003CCB76F1